MKKILLVVLAIFTISLSGCADSVESQKLNGDLVYQYRAADNPNEIREMRVFGVSNWAVDSLLPQSDYWGAITALLTPFVIIPTGIIDFIMMPFKSTYASIMEPPSLEEAP